MARIHTRSLMVRRDQIALGAVGLLVMFAGGWLFWYFAVRPHHPNSYSLFEIAILPVGLLVTGMLCLLAAVGEFTGTRLRQRGSIALNSALDRSDSATPQEPDTG
jgi:drug/metabolite transporter (DMT)-like permease